MMSYRRITQIDREQHKTARIIGTGNRKTRRNAKKWKVSRLINKLPHTNTVYEPSVLKG